VQHTGNLEDLISAMIIFLAVPLASLGSGCSGLRQAWARMQTHNYASLLAHACWLRHPYHPSPGILLINHWIT
jgi:hypothetical protein